MEEGEEHGKEAGLVAAMVAATGVVGEQGQLMEMMDLP